MMSRCYYEKSEGFGRYGGRGIFVEDRWHSFENFLADMGQRPEGTSLERNDLSQSYSRDNCRWATRDEQGRNRSDNVVVSVGGFDMTLTDACSMAGVNYNTARARIRRGWSIDRVLRRPQ